MHVNDGKVFTALAKARVRKDMDPEVLKSSQVIQGAISVFDASITAKPISAENTETATTTAVVPESLSCLRPSSFPHLVPPLVCLSVHGNVHVNHAVELVCATVMSFRLRYCEVLRISEVNITEQQSSTAVPVAIAL